MTNNSLPGSKSPYRIRSGYGERYLVGGQLVTLPARSQDTDGLLEAAVISGWMNDSFPPHTHLHAHETLMVLDGQLELTLNGEPFRLSCGDYANIPAETTHAYEMLSHHTRILR